MITVHNTPFLRFTIPLISGIALADFVPISSLFLLIFSAILFIHLLGSTILKIPDSQYELVQNSYGIAVLLLFFIFGILITLLHKSAMTFSLFPQTYFQLIDYFRIEIVSRYKSCGMEDNILATINALTLGDKSLLNNELKKMFVESGAMHILAVSGLHVGIIYLLLTFLLSPLKYFSKGKYWVCLFIIISLWAYAILTGMSSSVTRSVLMFSLFSIGKLFYRNTSSLNTIAATAFLMLIINPNYLFNLGFQLSFAAVTAIVLFYPIIYKTINSHFIVLDRIWALTAVSISAQLGVLPLSLYYFGQFPIYFLLSNIIVIILATGILNLFILFLISLLLPTFLTKGLGTLMIYGGKTLILAVSSIAKLPMSVIKITDFSKLEIVLSFILIYTLYKIIREPNFRSLIFGLSVTCLFVGINILQYFYILL